MNTAPYVVCFGEVLWDIFPSGTEAGGAPFNVAYNLSRMRYDVKMLSRVGDDELGRNLKRKINNWGMTSNYIQVDPEKPTSTVIATFNRHGDAVYDIVKDVAWDFIALQPEHKSLVATAGAFVFGSLSARNNETKQVLLSLLDDAKYSVFDVNLRHPFVDPLVINELLHKTDLVKMNKAELKEILLYLGCEDKPEDEGVLFIKQHFNIPEFILTKGSKGAKYYVGDKIVFSDAIPVEVADSVGSGDSFLAGFLSKRLINEKPEVIMKQASSLGAFVTSKFGACPDYTYEKFRVFREKLASIQ